MKRILMFLLLYGVSGGVILAEEKPSVTVGSKNFPENYILAEVLSRVIEQTGEASVDPRLGMGGTGLVYQALINGEVDLYPEYTGTIAQAILKNPDLKTWDEIQDALKEKKLVMARPFGFNNTYALAVREKTAMDLSLTKISDLKKNSGLRGAFSYEFMKRADGYPALTKHYGFKLKDARGMEHSLAYEALKEGKVDIIDVYTTDAKLEKLKLALLDDDKAFFPVYEGVILARADFVAQFPETWKALETLSGTLNDELMTRLNSLAEVDKKSFAEVAEIFLSSLKWQALANRTPPPQKEKKGFADRYVQESSSYWKRFWVLTQEHLFLVFVPLLASILIGISLGIFSYYFRGLGQLFLVLTGLLLTIPSLALMCFLIPFFGIGSVTAIITLFLYGLFPIVRSTYAGLLSLDPKLLETGKALGLTRLQILKKIQMPLASINIMAGIKTVAVMNVGTATLAAFIGAGGYGRLIATGLALIDVVIILKGALPAALMAIVVHWFFEILDTVLVPKGLRGPA